MSPCPAQHLCQQAYLTIAGSTNILPPSWNPTDPVPILSLAFMIFLKVPVVFSSVYKENYKFMYGTAIRNLFISVPSQFPIHGPLLFSLFPSSPWLLSSISSKISDDSSKTIGGVLSLKYLCFSTGYMGPIVQITSSICSLHL